MGSSPVCNRSCPPACLGRYQGSTARCLRSRPPCLRCRSQLSTPRPLGLHHRWISSCSSSSSGYEFNDSGSAHDMLRRKPQRGRTQDGIPLPEGWREHVSPSRGVYYAHAATGVVQWQFPKGAPTQAEIADSYREKYGDQIAKLQPGKAVILRGLASAPHLDGKTGTCEQWDYATGRVRVRLATGELKAIKPEFLVARDSLDFKAANREWHKAQNAKDCPIPGQRTLSGKAETTRDWSSGWKVAIALVGAASAYWTCDTWSRSRRSGIGDAEEPYYDPVAARWREPRTGRILPKSFAPAPRPSSHQMDA
mmetsp:Transcript_121265/g.343160  ORF Transcript_121265/g.343160 Transcript_121265/m.343160 type:complete len:309 (+) Transcript_121265:330-1256(+)